MRNSLNILGLIIDIEHCAYSPPTLISPENNLSGRRESNPVSTHPKRMYYRYTTARYFSDKISVRVSPFGLPRIELGLHPPHGRVLPLYYSPELKKYTKKEYNCLYLIHLFLITLCTINLMTGVWRKRCFKFVVATCFHTFAVVDFIRLF